MYKSALAFELWSIFHLAFAPTEGILQTIVPEVFCNFLTQRISRWLLQMRLVFASNFQQHTTTAPQKDTHKYSIAVTISTLHRPDNISEWSRSETSFPAIASFSPNPLAHRNAMLACRTIPPPQSAIRSPL